MTAALTGGGGAANALNRWVAGEVWERWDDVECLEGSAGEEEE